MSELEELEQKVLALYKQNTDKILERARQDVKDQNDEVGGREFSKKKHTNY